MICEITFGFVDFYIFYLCFICSALGKIQHFIVVKVSQYIYCKLNIVHIAWKVSLFGVILVRIFPHSQWIRENADQNNSEYKHFLRSGQLVFQTLKFFFYQGFLSQTPANHRTTGEGGGTIFYSTLPFPPTHEHSDIYLQLCMWDDYPVFLVAPLLFTILLLDEIYRLIELPYDWLMIQC